MTRALPATLCAVALCASCGQERHFDSVVFSHDCALMDGSWRCFDIETTPGGCLAGEDCCYRTQPRSRADDSRLDWPEAVAYTANSVHQCMLDEDGTILCDAGNEFDVAELLRADRRTDLTSISLVDHRGYEWVYSSDGEEPRLSATSRDGTVEGGLVDEDGEIFQWWVEGEYVDTLRDVRAHVALDSSSRLHGPNGYNGEIIAVEVDEFSIAQLLSLGSGWGDCDTCTDGDCWDPAVLSISSGTLTLHEPSDDCAHRVHTLNYDEMRRTYLEEAPLDGEWVDVVGGAGGACVIDMDGLATCWGVRPHDCWPEGCDEYIHSPPVDSRWWYVGPDGYGITRSGRAAVWSEDEVMELGRCWR